MDEFGGVAGRYERRSRYADRCSRHRREVWAERRRALCRRRLLAAPLLLVGLCLLAWYTTRETPYIDGWPAGLTGLVLLVVGYVLSLDRRY